MDFGSFLLQTQVLSAEQYISVVQKQINNTIHGRLKDGFVRNHLDNVEDLSSIRTTPFGDVLQSMDFYKQVKERAGADIPQLLERWWEWHLKNLEPIADYSTVSQFGKRLYELQDEKKRVARFVATADVRDGGRSIVLDGDIVVIPEGTSAFYVGMAIAALRKKVTMITSNAGLVREYRENPMLKRSLADFKIVGGEADSDYYASWGDVAQQQFDSAINKEPGATVVISSVNGLLPDIGPFAPNIGPAVTTRTSILDSAFHANVREVVFISDYTKHRASKQAAYGIPLFPDDGWKKVFSEHRRRISFITCPPPELRRCIEDGTVQTIEKRNLNGTDISQLKMPEVQEYEKAAKKLFEMSCGPGFGGSYSSMFHEAVCAFVRVT